MYKAGTYRDVKRKNNSPDTKMERASKAPKKNEILLQLRALEERYKTL